MDTEHVETLYVHKRRSWGVITLKFDYHEKDIGSTMSNQLAQRGKLSQKCAAVENQTHSQ